MPIQHEIHAHGEHAQAVPIRIWAHSLDDYSLRQLRNVAQLPVIHHHVAAMPDAHGGIGATVGSVLATREAIIPAAVGVDIGCVFFVLRLSLTDRDIGEVALKKVFDQISRDVPVGRAQHRDRDARVEAARAFEPGLQRLTDKHPQLLKAFGRFSNWVNQIGTLGSGNHFI